MAFQYEPHDWVPNEIITEEKLDHLESGIVDLVSKLQTVAESGSYNDLSNKPQINGHELSGDVTIELLGFHKVATSGKYDDLTGKPQINSHELTGNVSISSLGFHDVATSGSYNDLENKPTINGHELTGAQTTDSLDLRYTLPNASAETLGGVKVGERLSIDESGKLSVEPRLSQYTNDSDFQTKAEVATAINNAQHLKKKKVDVLPSAAEMEDDIIYMVPSDKSEENNVYDEYIKIDDKAELIGTTKIDLSEYAKLTDLEEFVNGGSIEGFTIKLDKKDNSQVEIQLPQNLSEFTNDENFTTKTQVQNMIEEAGAGGESGGNFKIEVIDEIPQPQQMDASTIYMVPRTEVESNNQYDEYVLVEDSIVERIGGSLTKEQLASLIAKASKYTVSVQSPEWSADGKLFKAVITINNLNFSEDNYGFIADIIQTDDAEQNITARENWNSIVRMTIENNQITIYSEIEFDSLDFQLLVFTIGESSGGSSFSISIVNSLPDPSDATEGVLYLLTKQESVEDNDKYDEYVFVKENNSFERIGSGTSGGTGGANNLKDAIVTLSQNSFTYDGETHAPTVTSVTYKEKPLQANKDYGVVISEATDAGTYNVLVFGIGEYSGMTNVSWTIEKAATTITLSSQVLTIKGIMGTSNSTITASKTGDGTLSVESVTPEFVNAELDGNKVKITSVKPGQGTVRVKTTNGINYADAQKDITVTVQRADGELSIQPTTLDVSGDKGTSMDATLSITGDGEITYTGASHVSVNIQGTKVTVTSVTEGTDNITINMAQTDSYTAASCSLKATVVFKQKKIYGVKWDGSSSPQLSRTDDAALFDDPTPALNNGSGSSPFDKLEPWCNIKKVTKDGNTLVAIPKFWYKITNNGGTGITIQIATYDAAGFKVSPAHMDRKDGVGERDWMYVGRYHCADDYKSKTSVKPGASKTRSAFRTGITGLGDGYYMWDYAMWKTIQMLYLVEFAHWDSQLKIGFGCGNGSSTENMGSTDTMTYHTGTKSSSRETYAVGTQYRYIEGLWDNVWDWLDGITYSSNNVYVGIEPSKYNDSTTNYTNVGKAASSGYISAWGIPTQSEYEWAIYPKTCSGGETTYVCDSFNSGGPCCRVGGYYNGQNRYRGLFCSNSDSTSSSYSYVGARIQYFPKAGEILS